MKKLVILISALSIIIYLSLWAWAVRWIDQDKDVADFMTEKKHLTLETAKFVWKITPALEREKDAERLLKISKWSLLTDIKPNWNYNRTNIKKNYKLISEYQKKHNDELKLNDKLEQDFLFQKLILINRSLGEIKDDDFNNSFKVFMNRYLSFRHIPWIRERYKKKYGSLFVKYVGYELKLYPEILWFAFLNEDVGKDFYVEYWRNFEETINDINNENNTKSYGLVAQYHWASMACYTGNPNHDKRSKEVFKIINNQLTENSEQYKILSKYFDEDPSVTLVVFPLIFSSKRECEKEAENFLSKMVEIAEILDKK